MKIQSQFEKHSQWPAVKEVWQKLTESGFKAYLAGGCVRDGLLGVEAKDFDVATNALPDAIEELFEKTIPVGRDFGVVIVPFDGFQVEVTTFREDGPYLNGRHPEKVVYSTPEADAQRRDFTINALFYDLKTKKILDFVGGVKDLESRILRTVGHPADRFAEDKLRMLRAVRFVAQLDFNMEQATFCAISEAAHEIQTISPERIYAELEKLILSSHRIKGLNFLVDSGLWPYLSPVLQKAYAGRRHFHSVYWQKAKLGLSLLPKEKRVELLWAWILSALELNGTQAKDFFRSLNTSRQLMDSVVWLMDKSTDLLKVYGQHPAQALRLLGEPMGLQLVDLVSLQIQVSGDLLIDLEKLVGEYKEICDEQGYLPKPWIVGGDVLGLGVSPGPQVGQLVTKAYDKQLCRVLSSRQQALEWLGREVTASLSAHTAK